MYQCRHTGASMDVVDNLRPLLEIKRRGRWHTEESLKRYAKGGRAAEMLAKASKLGAGDDADDANRGWLLEKQGDLDGAISAYRSAIRRDGSPAMPYVNLGLILAKRVNHAEAQGLFEKAARIEPADAMVQVNLGWVLLEQKSWPAAATACRKAVKLDSSSVLGWTNLGGI